MRHRRSLLSLVLFAGAVSTLTACAGIATPRQVLSAPPRASLEGLLPPPPDTLFEDTVATPTPGADTSTVVLIDAASLTTQTAPRRTPPPAVDPRLGMGPSASRVTAPTSLPSAAARPGSTDRPAASPKATPAPSGMVSPPAEPRALRAQAQDTTPPAPYVRDAASLGTSAVPFVRPEEREAASDSRVERVTDLAAGAAALVVGGAVVAGDRVVDAIGMRAEDLRPRFHTESDVPDADPVAAIRSARAEAERRHLAWRALGQPGDSAAFRDSLPFQASWTRTVAGLLPGTRLTIRSMVWPVDAQVLSRSRDEVRVATGWVPLERLPDHELACRNVPVATSLLAGNTSAVRLHARLVPTPAGEARIIVTVETRSAGRCDISRVFRDRIASFRLDIWTAVHRAVTLDPRGSLLR